MTTSLPPSTTRIRPVIGRSVRANRSTAELYEIPEAGHTSGLAARPEEYEARVTSFLERAL